MFSYEDLEYELNEKSGFPIRVATIETLIKLKKGTIRKIDQADALLLTEKLKEKKK